MKHVYGLLDTHKPINGWLSTGPVQTCIHCRQIAKGVYCGQALTAYACPEFEHFGHCVFIIQHDHSECGTFIKRVVTRVPGQMRDLARASKHLANDTYTYYYAMYSPFTLLLAAQDFEREKMKILKTFPKRKVRK